MAFCFHASFRLDSCCSLSRKILTNKRKTDRRMDGQSRLFGLLSVIQMIKNNGKRHERKNGREKEGKREKRKGKRSTERKHVRNYGEQMQLLMTETTTNWKI